MDDLPVITEINGGYVMRHQLNDLGYGDAQIRWAVKARILTRVRHGTYVMTAAWAVMTESERHRVVARSVLDKLGPSVIASHQTAAAIHGFDLHDVDLTMVHVTRLDGRPGRKEAGVVYHHGLVIPDDDVREVDSLLVSSPMRAVFEACSIVSVEAGMVIASSALHSGAFTKLELSESGLRYDHWKGTRRARLSIRLSDGRLESVGETRSLHMMWRHGIPSPELQHPVTSVDGVVIARTDFAWLLWRHTGEFDGLVKYGRLNPYSIDPGRVIADEKMREDMVREQLLGMSRWGWSGLAPTRQAATAERIQRGMEQSRKLYTRNGTVIPLS